MKDGLNPRMWAMFLFILAFQSIVAQPSPPFLSEGWITPDEWKDFPLPKNLYSDTLCYQPPYTFPVPVPYVAVREAPIPIRSMDQPGWLFLIFFFQWIMLGLIRNYFLKMLQDMFKAAFNLHIAQQLYREQENNPSFATLWLNVNFILGFSIFIVMGWRLWHDQNTLMLSPDLFLGVFLLTYLLWTLQFGKWNLMGWLFNLEEAFRLMGFSFMVVLKVFGIFFMVINMIMAYAPIHVAIIGLFIALAALGFLILNVFFQAMRLTRLQWHRNQFHFILYICTLEILPFALFIKWVSGWNL